jgi:hypothetical protein
MNLFNDPMAAAFIPLVLLLAFAWGMYFSLRGDADYDGWWINILEAVHLAPKPPESDMPVGTRMNVLDIGAPAAGQPRNEEVVIDYGPVLERSRLFFKSLGLLMLLLLCIHGFRYYRRIDPYFLVGPQPSKPGAPGQGTPLPPRVPGAGGAGAPPVAGAPQPFNRSVPPPRR